MAELSVNESAAGGLAVAPSLTPLAPIDLTNPPMPVDARVVAISGVAMGVAVLAGLVSRVLARLIDFFTNLAFYGRFSLAPVSPAHNTLGAGVLFVPIAGGLVVGLMARYGSKAIRGHGIPEAMEQVLTNESRIPARMTFLKPLSAAIAIGTGGPFGAEGPIIATGGALGSLAGQLLHTSAVERKTLLAAGAAAGMAATFGSPISAVLLAVELLLFEYRPRSLVPVALATVAATGVRILFAGSAPAFPMADVQTPSDAALACYVLIGALIGVASVYVTRSIYAIENAFEKLPIHWMWWPAFGGAAVGLVGYVAPRTLGVGYDNIIDILNGSLLGTTLVTLCVFKLISWSLSLGSGTSGGTLAPLFTIGGSLGAILGEVGHHFAPGLHLDPRIAALIGMAAMFAGASRALLASIVFAFETTRQPAGLLPLLGGCTAAFFVSCLLMRHSIMTEKIVRRGVNATGEYSIDFLSLIGVREVGLRRVVTLRAGDTLEATRVWLASGVQGTSHQGFPIVDEHERLIGVLTRRDLFESADGAQPLRALIRRSPVAIADHCSLRDAADRMAAERIGRLPIVSRQDPHRVIGIVTRSDLVDAHQRRLTEQSKPRRNAAA